MSAYRDHSGHKPQDCPGFPKRPQAYAPNEGLTYAQEYNLDCEVYEFLRIHGCAFCGGSSSECVASLGHAVRAGVWPGSPCGF